MKNNLSRPSMIIAKAIKYAEDQIAAGNDVKHYEMVLAKLRKIK